MTAHHEKLISDLESAALAQIELERRANVARGCNGSFSDTEAEIADLCDISWSVVRVLVIGIAAIVIGAALWHALGN